jgi:hypothetical protein
MQNPNLIFGLTPIQLLLIFPIILAMYLARSQFHQAITSLSQIIYSAMRIAAKSVKQAEKRLDKRNREVLLLAGLDEAERRMEREFDRISGAVQRDLPDYPKLQRNITEVLMKLDEDYRQCSEIPQGIAEWDKVLNAIANIKPSNDPIVTNMLEDILATLKDQHKTTLESHRKDVAERHSILTRMLPVWQSISKKLDGLAKSISELINRSEQVDHYMESYKKVKNRTDMAERQLSSSSMTQFFTSGLVLAVFAVGTVINFNLIALPMSELVGGSSTIGAFKTSDVAGMIIVCLEIVVGIFLMDALRFTRLFSVIGCLDDRKRKIFFWVLLAFLTIFAGVESSLAFMRDRIAADMEALRQSLAGIEPTTVAASKIPTIGQMILGFILPFILTTVAMPFETFVSSFRTILGLAATGFLRFLAFLLRLIGNLGFYAGRLIINIYDILIFPALWLERVIMAKFFKSATTDKVKPINMKERNKQKAAPSPSKPTEEDQDLDKEVSA